MEQVILSDNFDTDDRTQISDGYHTFEELYTHRHALFLALAKALGTGWRSKQHADGTMHDGWFVAGLMLPVGEVTYHLPSGLWEHAHMLHIYERAPSWDGHTPADVVRRLLLYAQLDEVS